MPSSKKPSISSFGELKAAGYKPQSVRDEIRANLMQALRENRPLFPGIVGYEHTVIPQVINALLSRHNILLLGLRGQAKTRLMRQIADFLDEWMPIVAGSEINDDPFHPISLFAREQLADKGDETLIDWVPREERYREKLATPDVSIADLIGDLDPVKAAAQKLSFSHEAVINFGIIPRTNRGIFAINELPDLQPRIQVGLFNILEEKDVQIRGFPVRLAVDILLVFTANPEDYTNRGSIITPLKDRIESQIITHYPGDLAEAMTITDQEAWTERQSITVEVPDFIRRIIDRISFRARQSEYVDQNSGVSARLPIAALENVLSNAERRAAMHGSTHETARVLDVFSAVPAITGKLELVYEGEQEGPYQVANVLIGQAIREEFDALFPSAYRSEAAGKRRGGHSHGAHGGGGKGKGGQPRRNAGDGENDGDLGIYKPVIDFFSRGEKLRITDDMSAEDYQSALEKVPGLHNIVMAHLNPPTESTRLAAMELVLEGLHQASLLAKEDIDRGLIYCDMLGSMLEDFGL